MSFKEGLNKYFSAGLGKKGQIAAWGVAIGVVAAWNYMSNQKAPKELIIVETGPAFTKEEQEEWNKKQRLKFMANGEQAKDFTKEEEAKFGKAIINEVDAIKNKSPADKS